MCVKCRINGELCCGRRCTRGAWSASRCCMDLGAGETACVPPGSESCWIHALLCAVCHREGVFVCADRPPGIPFARRTVDMNNSKNSVRTLTMLALLVAMSIVFSWVLSISTGFVRFNLGSLPVLLAALLFGPGAGFAVGLHGRSCPGCAPACGCRSACCWDTLWVPWSSPRWHCASSTATRGQRWQCASPMH